MMQYVQVKLKPRFQWQNWNLTNGRLSSPKTGVKLKRLLKCYIWSIVLYYAESWTFREVDAKYLERCEI